MLRGGWVFTFLFAIHVVAATLVLTQSANTNPAVDTVDTLSRNLSWRDEILFALSFDGTFDVSLNQGVLTK